jgi:hypothetical protein
MAPRVLLPAPFYPTARGSPALEGEVDVGVGDHAGERFAEVMPLEGGVAALEDTGAVRCAHFVGICPRTPSTK